jgi:ATP-binding cassette subfamily C protein
MRRLIGELRALLVAGERRRWQALVPLMVVGGVVETVATGLVFVLIKVASDPGYADHVEPLATLVALLPWRGQAAVVVTYGALLALFFILRSLLLVLVTYLSSRAAADTMAGLATRMLARYLAAPYAVHLRHNPAELAFHATKGVEQAVGGLSSLVLLASEALVALGLCTFLVVAAPLITLVSGGVLGIFVGLSLFLTKRSSTRIGRLRHTLEMRALKDVGQSLGGLRELKVLGREAAFHDAFAAEQRTLALARRRHATLMAVPRLAIETIFVCSVVLIVALVVLGERRDADLLPLLGLYAYAGFRLIPSANRVILHLDSLRGATAAMGRLFADFEEFAPPASHADGAEPPLAFHDALRLEGVSYSYAGAPRPVLADVSLTIPRGAGVGVVGPTGAGKSTLIDLILGLLDPTAGRITIDGVPLATARRAWQRRIGYVPQVAYLFDDTLRRNVALGIPDAEIDEARVLQALALAQLDGFVTTLPEGLATRVGDRGVRLSGGQRQRVAIARALYHEPELLVFDEATAALDNVTEREVTAAIEALRGKKTIIIIAHRLSTVERCDTLVFLKGGRVAAVGPYLRLLDESADFRAMAAPSSVNGR